MYFSLVQLSDGCNLPHSLSDRSFNASLAASERRTSSWRSWMFSETTQKQHQHTVVFKIFFSFSFSLGFLSELRLTSVAWASQLSSFEASFEIKQSQFRSVAMN